MGLFLFCSVVLFFGEVPLDDVNTKGLGGAAQIDSKVLIFNYVEPKLTLIDMKTGMGKIVDDARYPVMSIRILSQSKAFLLFDVVAKRVFTLDSEGRFTSAKELPKLPPAFGNLRLTGVSLEPSGAFLVNLKGEAQQLLARLDLAKGTWHQLLRREADPKRNLQWFAYGEKWLEVEQSTGRLQLIDPHDQKKRRQIFKGREPVTKTVGRTPYYAILEMPQCVDDACYFMWKCFMDPYGNQLSMPLAQGLVVNGERCYETPRFILGRYNQMELSFDSEERMLLLTDPMRRKPVGGAR